MTVENLLDHLEKVRQTGAGRWIARCPAHDDKGPSLSIRELEDGRVLLHCFAGCEVEAILDAVGMTFGDLFPPRPLGNCTHPERRPFPAADVLRCLAHESLVVASCVASMLGDAFTPADRERLVLAVARIQAALDVAGVSHARA